MLRQALSARLLDLTAPPDSPSGRDVEAAPNPFRGASMHAERDASGLLDLSWSPNQLIYAFAGRAEGAPPMPALDLEHRQLTSPAEACTGLMCVAHHSLMFAKMRRVAQQLR
eukprot:COSAG04_NODE_3035_length_3250_cov_2.899714_3_plen_112_part_00